MADTKITDLTAITGANLATGDELVVVDISDTTMAASGTNKSTTLADIKTHLGLPAAVYNASVTAQAGFSSDTYLTGSNIAIPSGRLKATTIYRCTFNVVKTNAGTATPILNIRFGTAGTTSDTSRGQHTFTAGTAAADEGVWDVWAVFRTVGSGTTAVLQSLSRITHKLSVTGITGTGATSEAEIATSGGFDSTVASSIIGCSVNGGTSASWTVSLVAAELINLT
jgi:hypothetical protein